MANGQGDNSHSVGGAMVSQGTVPGTQAAIPTLKPHETYQAPSHVPGFEGASSSLALTPSALGQIGSTLAMQSGIELAKRQGTLLGKNPEGDLLPAFTPVDKAFIDSYSTQAKATLGLQVNALIDQSEETINQGYKLSPDAIAKFQQSTFQGIQKILANAPNTIRPEMENQYANQLLNSSHQMNMKMMNQQKADEKEKIELANNDQIKGSFNNAYLSNDPQTQIRSKQSLNDFKNDLARQRSAGIIDRKTEQSSYESAKLNYYAGDLTRRAMAEKAAKNLPEFLRTMHAFLPDDLSPLDKITVGNHVLEYVNAVHSQEAQDNQLILSQLNRAFSEKTLNGSMLAQAESILDPTEFNNFMAKFWGKNNKESIKQAEMTEAANNFSDIYKMAQYKPAQKDAGYNALTAKKMREQPDSDILNVQTGIVKGAGSEVPAFTRQLNAMVLNGGPDAAYRASRAYQSVEEYAPQNVASVDPNAKALMTLMNDLHQDGGLPIQDAWSQARQQVLFKTKDEQEAMEEKYKQIKKNNFATTEQIQNHAKSLLNKDWGATIPDLPQVANRIQRVWKDWFMITGSYAAADKLTEQGLKRSYGNTYINGGKQLVLMPVETFSNVGKDGVGLIHQDIIRDVSKQLEPGVESYTAGKTDWFYRIPQKDSVKDGQVQVERVWRGTKKNPGIIEHFTLNITANRNLQLTNNQASPYAGYYDVGLKDANGFPAPFAHVSNGQSHTFGYRPDVKAINDGYVRMHHNGLTAQQDQQIKIEETIAKFSKVPSIEEKKHNINYRGQSHIKGTFRGKDNGA